MIATLVGKSSSNERSRLQMVFFVACSLIALEIVSFQTLIYVNEYLPATQVISVALLGISLGGLLSYFVGRGDVRQSLLLILVLFPISVIASFPIIIRLNDTPYAMMVLLTIPYILASLFISIMFNTLKPNRVYMVDLIGAGLGAFVAVILIPFLREEGSFAMLGLIATVPLFLLWRSDIQPGKKPFVLSVAIVLIVLFVTMIILHIAVDPFNMANIAIADKKAYPSKIFRFTVPEQGKKEAKHKVKYSRGSLVERIDIGYWTKDRKNNPRGHDYITWFNGRPNDHVQRFRPKVGWMDRRLPTLLKLGEDPDTLLIGPAAEGLTKPVIALGSGHVDAVEINGAVAKLMLKELYRVSGKAYKDMNLTMGDARTFLDRTDRKYDFITLLNTHRIQNIGHQGPPEYCHTMEAMEAYISHLKDDGYVVFEERNVNERADLGIRRFLRTALVALKKAGASNPADHVALYEFFVCHKKVWFTNRDKCRRGGRYTMVMVKKNPITQKEYDHFLEWEKLLGERIDKKKGYYRGIEWMYLPQDQKDNYWTRTIVANDVYKTDGVDTSIHNMSLVTDDKPFPYDVYKARTSQWDVLKMTAILSLTMVLLPAFVTFFSRRDSKGTVKSSVFDRTATNALLVLYFACLGIAYLLIEIVLMQKFQMFLSSPTYSLTVVLGTMLIASGIGGFMSARIGKKGALLSLVAVVALTLLYHTVLEQLLGALMFLPFVMRILVAVILIGFLAFFMGIPFPYALELSKQRLSNNHAGLFFGINGAVAAVASPVSIILSMTKGFSFTILVGGMAYLACLILLFLVRATPRGSKISPA